MKKRIAHKLKKYLMQKEKRIYYYIIYELEKEYCYCIRNER